MLFSISACGPKKVLLTENDLNAAYKNGNIMAFYNKVQNEIKTSRGKYRSDLETMSRKVADRIALDQQTKIYQDLENSRIVGGIIPITIAQQQLTEAESLKTFDQSRYEATQKKISMEITRSQDTLSSQLSAIGKIPQENDIQRLSLMAKAAGIAGEGSQYAETYQLEKSKWVTLLKQQAQKAMNERKFSKASTYLRKILNVSPDEKGVKDLLKQTQQGDFEVRFRKFLEEGKPDIAYQELIALVDASDFDNIRKKLGNDINLLVRYFENQALQATSQGSLKKAHAYFKKSRHIRQLMQQTLVSDVEFTFLKRMMNLAKFRGSEKRYGEQLAYLEVVAEFNPKQPGIQQELKETRKKLTEYASTSIFVKDFSQTGTHHSAGKSVAQKVYGWVYDHLLGDVVLVHDENLLKRFADSPGQMLVLEGDVLEAGVDQENNPGKKTMRVVTETIKKSNPEYEKWKRSGETDNKPEEFLVSEKKEDISINVTNHRKTGVLVTAYRLIDSRSDKVIINENARDKKLYEGESSEGVNIGEFQLPYKPAELPSDTEVMEQLSTSVADVIGKKIKTMLRDPDIRYETLGDEALKKNQYEAAKNYFGYGLAIRTIKGGDVTQLRKKLVDLVMAY